MDGQRVRLSAVLGILVCAGALLAAQAGADCIGSPVLTSFAGPDPAERSYIWTASVFSPLYFDTSYAPLDYKVPVTPNLSASFWEAGSGDPAIGAGNDNGTFDLYAAGMLSFGANPDYNVFYAAVLDAGWPDGEVDGCTQPNACTCLLFADQDMAGRGGYFALVAARADGLADTSFNLGGADPVGYGLPIVLRPIPVPGVTGAVSPQAGTVEITVMLGDNMAGVYEAESGAGCSCGPIEYSVYRQTVTTGADWVPPDDRDPAAWTLATLAGGGAQAPTALGQPVTLSIDCTTPALDHVYLATRLHFDSGFASAWVSANSIPVACDGSLPLDPLSQRRRLSHQGRGGKVVAIP